jgi:hypothetical protein
MKKLINAHAYNKGLLQCATGFVDRKVVDRKCTTFRQCREAHSSKPRTLTHI